MHIESINSSSHSLQNRFLDRCFMSCLFILLYALLTTCEHFINDPAVIKRKDFFVTVNTLDSVKLYDLIIHIIATLAVYINLIGHLTSISRSYMSRKGSDPNSYQCIQSIQDLCSRHIALDQTDRGHQRCIYILTSSLIFILFFKVFMIDPIIPVNAYMSCNIFII